jgi:hypothetical protein
MHQHFEGCEHDPNVEGFGLCTKKCTDPKRPLTWCTHTAKHLGPCSWELIL